MRIVSIKLPPDMDRELTLIARKRRSTRSAVVRDALNAYSRKTRKSVITAAGGLVGSMQGGPPDLSVGSRHLTNHGK